MKIADKKNIEDILPLTPMQEGMLFHYLKDRESDYYFEQLYLTVTGDIDLTWFRQAWALVVETNEMLRTSFKWEKMKKPLQVVIKQSPLQFIFHDFSNGNINENDKRNLVQGIKDNDRKNKFNLDSVPFRITLCKIGQAEFEMMVSNHHILYDGWSNGILLKEFFSFYNHLVQKKSPVKPHKHKYKEYISWIQRQDVQKQREYWARYLNGFETKSELSIKRRKWENINTPAPGNSHYNVKFSKKVREKLEIFIKSHKITLAGLLYSAWGILLQRYYNSEDVIFGTTVSGRSSEVKGIEDIVGLFINTVPLRVRTNCHSHEKVKDFLSRVNKELREREGYESASLAEIKEYGGVVFENQLFDTIFVIENYPLDKVLAEINNPLSLSVNSYSMFETTHYDLTVSVTLVDDIEMEFTYNQDLFDESIIKELSCHFMKIAADMVDNPGKELAALEILSEGEKNKVLFEFNNTAADYARDKTIHQLFAEQVERIPNHIALIGQNSKQEGTRGLAPWSDFVSITYRELNNQSNRLACILTGKGVSTDTIVGIAAERSIEMIVGILGILKAGRAYMPIDPEYPQERINYMLEDAMVNFIVRNSNKFNYSSPEKEKKERFKEIEIDHYQLSIVNCQREIASLAQSKSPLERGASSTCLKKYGGGGLCLNLQPAACSTHLAYIIYTSGTTGKPRGVMIEHAAVMNRLLWVRDKYRLNERDVILQATSFVFDVSVCEMFRWIPAGGKLCLLPAGGEKDPGKIIRTIARNGVTTADFIPATLTLLLDYAHRQNLVKALASLRWVWTGVEVVDVELVKEFNETLHRLNRTRLINAYGPTESTVDVTYFDCSHIENDDVVPIGRPMANVRIYILARNGAVQPVGVYGQLCIAGKALARGYLNNPELTNFKFQIPNYKSQITNKEIPSEQPMQSCNHASIQSCSHASRQYHSIPPHFPITPSPHSPIYYTGDLARWLPDGNIQFLGRIDHQVKIRGHRVELGEIESRLLRHEKIKDAVVIVKDGNEKEKLLCAYIISDESIDTPGLGEELSLELPDYMVPSYIIQLDKIPITPGGKVDRRALPEPGSGVIGVKYTAPIDPLEEKLVSIWSDVLNLEKNEIGTGYNFFKLGGHSLKAVRLISGIQKELNVEVPLEEIFKLPTIKGLVGYIRGLTKEKTGEQYIPVELMEEKEYYTLASAQRRLYFLQEIDENATAYNMPSVWLLEGDVDKMRLEGTLKKLIQRHESLRTSFKVIGDEPMQVVHEEPVIGHWSLVIGEDEKNDIEEIIRNFIKPFDLSRAPLLRVGLIKLLHTPAAPRPHPSQEGKEDKYLLMVDMHHIISDGISVEILIKEFMAFWPGKKLPPVKLRYRDFSEWQNYRKQKAKIKRQEAYWLKQFEGEIPVLDLTMDYTRPSMQNFEGCTIHFEIDKEKTDALKSLAHHREVTLFMLLLSIYNIFLSRLSSQEDIVVGTPTSGRRCTDLEPLIGMFVNTLAMRNFPIGPKHFSRFLGEVKENTIKAFENQDYLYEDLVEQLVVERDTGRNPLFDSMFVLQNMDFLEIEIPGLKVQPVDFETHISKFDLTLIAEEVGGNLLFTFEYCTILFKEETIRRFIGYFDKIISTVLGNPGITISGIEIINEEEKNQVLYTFNDTGAEYPRDKTIPELFAQQVEQRPHQVALVGKEEGWKGRRVEGMHFSYGELNEKSNQLAYYLMKERGVGPDTIVGIMVKRSIELIIGLLGILKAGGTYLPIDPSYPRERIDFMLKDSGACILLTALEIACFSSQQAVNNRPKNTSFHLNLTLLLNSPINSLAYVIYTSGSTGKPKAVLIEHRSILNYIFWRINEYQQTSWDISLQLVSFNFDGFCANFYPTLLSGGAVVFVGQDKWRDVDYIRKVLREEGVTNFSAVPSLYRVLLDGAKKEDFRSIRFVVLAGDKASKDMIRLSQTLLPAVELINEYGPTENTVTTTCNRGMTPGNEAIIGKPIANNMVYIMDECQNLNPPGTPGELCISGAGLARGYLNNPELTAEKFCLQRPGDSFWKNHPPDHETSAKNYLLKVPDKDQIQPCNHGSMHFPITPILHYTIYRTGDLVRWLYDGNIEFLGRMDHQVKIRGFRIEPGEIENQLLAHENIKEAIVMTREENNNDKYLCAYMVAKPGETNPIDQSELREYLSNRLPDYMVPSYFVQLDNIPLTPNGKIDRKALPESEIKTDKNYIPPKNEIEKKLVDIWSEILDVEKEKISINDNFFHLGGHSLKATALAARIHNQLNINVPLTGIFKTPYIHQLAAYIKEAARSKHIPVESVEKKEYYPLSSAQRRLYILQQMDAEKGIAYNMPSVWQLEGDLDIRKFETVFHQLIQRHESLRTLFFVLNDEPVQRIKEEVQVKVDDYEGTRGLAPLPELAKRKAQSAKSKKLHHAPCAGRCASTIKYFIRPFDLSQAPLLRVGLIRLLHTPSALCGHPSQEGKGDNYLLMVDMHHIVSDGLSIGIFVKEFMELYAGKRLPQLRLQYKDYSAWHKRHAGRKFIKEQETYWLKQFQGKVPVLNIPADYLRPSVQDFAGRTLHVEINKEETAALKSLARQQDVTLFMLLLSVCTVFLCKLSGQEDIVVGTPIAGRRHTDLAGIIGMFVNTLALRNFPIVEKSFCRFLGEIKKNTIKAFENQDYLYEDLVEQVEVERDASRNPLFDMMFSLQNMDTPAVQIPGLKAAPYHYESHISKFDLTLTAVEIEDRLAFTFEYCSNLFKKETIQRFTRFFKKTVSTVLENHETRISGIDIITEEEKNRILMDFNDTEAEYPRDKTIHQLFEEQVEQRPNQVALVGGYSKSPRDQIQNSKATGGRTRLEGTRGLAPLSDLASITYRELNHQSNRLAHILTGKGVGADAIVGIMVERSIEMIVGILGILKAGGAYLPIDPDYPEKRISYMLVDSGTDILLTTPDLSEKFEKLSIVNCQLLMVNALIPVPRRLNIPTNEASSPLHLPPVPVTCLAYVIYTSGSTGNPKGTLIQHRSLMNRLNWMQVAYPLGKEDVILQKTTYTFDVSVWELLWWGIAGAGVYLLKPGEEKDLVAIAREIRRQCITTIHFVPSMLKIFLDYVSENNIGVLYCKTLRHVFASGEALSADRVEQFYRWLHEENGTHLINLYGPTEATIDVSYFNCTGIEVAGKMLKTIPIGKPIENTWLYILDRNMKFQPVGLEGELFIGGVGLARGYLNNPALTFERFINFKLHNTKYKKITNCNVRNYKTNCIHADMQSCNHASMHYHSPSPHHPNTPRPHSPHSPHSPIYRTGDLARWLSDGNIDFLGRMDHQVKIRGFRIELGEIENQLQTHEKVKEAIVLSREDNNDNNLCAYIVTNSKETNPIDSPGLREYLSHRLPDYMVPAYFVQLDNIPLTPNGKIDRKALPAPMIETGEGYEPPRNDIEKKLVSLWSEILDVEKEKIGINDNFFHLGGHSLKATVLISRIHKELNINIPLTRIFKTPYIHGLSAFIKKTARSKHLPVESVEKKEYYPLSSAQRRLYFLQQMDAEKGIAYNIPSVWQLKGNLEVGKFEMVFHQLIQRHESLRTSFIQSNDEPVQSINEKVEVKVDDYEGTRGLAPLPELAERKAQSAKRKKLRHAPCAGRCASTIKYFIRPFDLSQAPLLRVGLIRLLHTPSALRGHPSQEGKGDNYLLMVDMHHIVSDGLSIGIFVKEFMELYAGKKLPQLRLQYKDYSEWHNRQVGRDVMKEQQTYWLKQFAGEVPVLDLPADYPRPVVQGFAGGTIHFKINKGETAALKSLAREQEVTMFMLLLSLYAVFLCKLCNQEDIVVGTPVASRRHTDLEGIIGMFVNTLALRNFPAAQKTFHRFLDEIKENTLKAFENQDYLYEDLVEKVVMQRDASRNPLFDTMFTLQNEDTPTIQIPGLKVGPYHYKSRISKFDLTLTAIEIENRMAFTFQYCTNLFKKETIRRFTGLFMQTISTIVDNHETRISGIEIITLEEKRWILQGFNDTGVEYPRTKTIHQLFEEQVEQRPDNIAVIGEMQSAECKAQSIGRSKDKERHALCAMRCALTYRELNNQSNRLARILTGKGVKPDIMVGIMVERSIEIVVGILGILKAGGTYLPVDPEYPRERIYFMLKESNAGILLTTQLLSKKIGMEICVLYLDEMQGQESVVFHHQAAGTFSNFAYIMYTSGTSGGPKGILVSQRNVVRLVKNTNYIKLTEKTRILQTGAPVFDATTFEIWGSLLNGGQLLLTSKEAIIDARQLGKTLERFDINTLWLSAPLFNQLSDYDTYIFSSLDYLLVGGDVLSSPHINRVMRALPGLTVINGYGPTENTTFSTAYHIREEFEGRIPIGKPIANSTAYIVDINAHLQPIGVSGQLLVGGDGVSCGYLNNPELTFEKFVHDLWDLWDYQNKRKKERKKVPGKRIYSHMAYRFYMSYIYRTGDLARWLPDGNIDFLGRMDQQVKIRGFRIELGEIENRLITHGKIKEAMVMARENNNDKYLCAYIVAKPGETNPIDVFGLREYLSNSLPGYMVPSYFVLLDRIPLTLNGKVDGKSLPEPEKIKTLLDYTPPQDEIEEKLVELWSEVLNIEKEKIGVYTNFFEAGGHSLNALKMVSKLGKALDIKVSVTDLFKNPILRSLSEYLQELKSIKDEPLDFETTNRELKKNFSNVELVNYVVDGRDYIVLYADKEIREVLNFIQLHFSRKCIPHFVRPFQDRMYHTHRIHIKKERLNEILKLYGLHSQVKMSLTHTAKAKKQFKEFFTSGKINWQHVNLPGFFKDSLKRYINTITGNNRSIHSIINSNQIIDSYDAGFYQFEKLGDGGGFERAITIEVEIEGILNPEEIKQSIIKMFEVYPLLRTVLKKDDSNLVFKEYGSQLNNLEFAVLDLSVFDDSVQTIICNLLAFYLFYMTTRNGNLDTLLFNIAVIQLNLHTFKFLLSINHIISDIKAVDVLKKYYREYFSKRYAESNRLKYKDYLHYLSKLSDADGINRLKNCYEYKTFKKNVLAFREKHKIGDYLRFSDAFIIEYSNDPDLYENHIPIAFFIAVKIINIVFTLNKIPIKFVHNKRIIGDKNFMNSLGIFQDYLLLVSDAEENSYHHIYSDKLHQEKKFSENRFHVRSMRFRDKQIKKIIDHAPFLFNFQGEREFDVDIDSYDIGGVSDKEYLDYKVKSHYIRRDNRLIISIHNGIKRLGKIKALLETLRGDIKFKFVPTDKSK